MTPPGQLQHVAELVDARMAEVLDVERKRWNEIDPRLTELVEELSRMVSSGGKKLRAAFVYWAWRGTCKDEEQIAAMESLAVDAGAAFEFLQTFALIHDDIMDDSTLRRGSVTVHTANAERLTEQGWSGEPRRYGDGVAILVGDLGHVLADHLMTVTNPHVRRLWDDLRIELNLGQYLDLRAAAAGEFDRETAQRVVTFKTALYTIVRPLQLGASLSIGASGSGDTRTDDEHQQLLAHLDRFGRPLGRAFQLRDDVLGLTGDNAAIGKPVGDDLREGKPTEMMAHALANATAAQRSALDRIGDRQLSADDAERIISVFEQTGALAANEAEVDRLLIQSGEALATLPVSDEAKEALAALARYVVERDR